MKCTSCLSIFVILIVTIFSFSIISFFLNKQEGFLNSGLLSTAIQQRSELDTYDYNAKKIHRFLPSFQKYCSRRPSSIKASGFVIDPLKASDVFYSKKLTIDKPTYDQWLRYKNKKKKFWIPPKRSVCPKGCEWDTDNMWRCNSNNVEHNEYCDPNDITTCYGCDVCGSL